MRTVKEVSSLTGVSIRTLHYYDSIGLLRPTQTTESGYRLYDDNAMERLQYILLLRELKFPLKEIKRILDSSSLDRSKAIEQQIRLLTLQKEHIENLINLARGIQMVGVRRLLDFSAFDTRKIDEYAEQVRASWGQTETYHEFEEKSKYRTPEEEQELSTKMMKIFRSFGKIRNENPEGDTAQRLVKELQDFITENFYTCTPKILACLGGMYADGGNLGANIDKEGGEGTAVFVEQAILAYCK